MKLLNQNTLLAYLLVCITQISIFSQEFDGYCLYNAINDRTTYLIDAEGDIAHTWNCNAGGNYAVALKENGNIVRGAIYSGNIIRGAAVGGMVQEYDHDGNVVWEFVYSTATLITHHDITLMPNGNVMLTAWETKSRAELQEKGYIGSSQYRYVTHFIEIAQNGTGGEIVWEWHLWDHLVQDVDPTLDNYGEISENPQLLDINVTTSGRGNSGDWFHVNGIDYDPRLDQITFSSRYLSEIFVIDHSTTTEEAATHSGGNSGMGGDLLYRWGNPGNYNTPGDRIIPAACHDARFIDNNGGPNDGFIQIFNNSGNSGNSTVDAIETPRNGFVYDKVPGKPYEPAQPTWRHFCRDNANGQSASNRLPNGNTFVCLSGGYLYEVDSIDNLVWQYPARTAKAFRYTCDYPGIIALLNNPCDISTSTATHEEVHVMVGPNPTSGLVHIAGDDFRITVRKIEVYDLNGRIVMSADNESTIDMGGLTAGTYAMCIEFSNIPPVSRVLTLVNKLRNTLYILVAFILASTWHQASAQGEFYNVDEIQEVKIYFQQKNWDHLLDSFYVDGQKERLLGAVELNGTYFDSVGIRYKGFSSVSVDRKKNPFNIKLDYVKNQSYQGIDKVKLSNVIQDPSFLREVLSYNIARDYMPASQANFANVYINDTLWGLYTNVESVNKEFLIQHFPSTDNAFFKCNPEDLDFDGENSNLGDSPGMDSTEYFDLYDMRSDHGWSKLLKLIDHLNQSPERIEDVLNVDRALWMHAFNYVLINFDSYVGYAQNYYLYEDDFGIFHPIIWDLNMSFASFRFTDASEHFDGFSIREAINMDPLLHYTSVSIFPRPLMRNLFSDDTYRRMYLAHMRTILNDHFQSGAFYAKASDWKALISPHVLADTNKFYTDEDFNENIDTAVSDLIDYPGIKQLMEGRINYLMDYPGIKDPPAITDVMHAPDRPSHNDMVFITAKIEGASDVRMYSRDTQGAPFTWNAMFDDGLHGDGAAGDGVYGIDLNFASRPLEYYIYAENDDAGVFSPQSAAYKFFHIRGQTEPDELVINEIMSSNSSTVSDELGEFDDWIEIYNTTEDSISTSGLYLSDDSTAKFKWAIPDTVIPGGDYLLIWADGDTGQGKWHSNFRLSSLGESLYMTSIDSQVIDQVDFPMLQSDVSYGRYPNGTGPFQSMTPTPNSENLPDLPDDGKTLTVAPNPCTTSELSLSRSHAEGSASVRLHDMTGKLISKYRMDDNQTMLKIDTRNLISGFYQLDLKDDNISESEIIVVIN